MAMQDMVPPDEDSRSIRNLKINKEKDTNPNDSDQAVRENKEGSSEPVRFRENNYKRRNKSYKGWIIGLAAIIIIFVFIALTPVLSSAKIDITPKSQPVEIDGDFRAAADESSEVDIIYQTATFEMIGEKEVQATGEEKVDTKASGRIRVYNNFSEEAETLIANTRFESKSGLIYRVQNAFTVPGRKQSNGETVPGTVDVTVYADEAGENYNVASTEFTIPGLKGDSRFDAMRAETITAIEGGFSGITKVASEGDIIEALEAIEKEATTGAIEKAESEIPDEFVRISDVTHVSFERIPNGESNQEDSLLVRGRAVATAPLIKKSSLASFIAAETIGTYDRDEEVRIDDIENTVNIEAQATEGASIEDSIVNNTPININISGDPVITWVVDYESLEDDLLGVSQSEAQQVLSGYGSIREAQISISPFWKRTIPENREKLEINETIEQ